MNDQNTTGFNPFPADETGDTDTLENEGPKEAITSEDGTQSAPQMDESSIPPYNPHAQVQPEPTPEEDNAPIAQELPTTTASEQHTPVAEEDSLTKQDIEGLLEESASDNGANHTDVNTSFHHNQPQPEAESPFAATAATEEAAPAEQNDDYSSDAASPSDMFASPTAESLSLADPGSDISSSTYQPEEAPAPMQEEAHTTEADTIAHTGGLTEPDPAEPVHNQYPSTEETGDDSSVTNEPLMSVQSEIYDSQSGALYEETPESEPTTDQHNLEHNETETAAVEGAVSEESPLIDESSAPETAHELEPDEELTAAASPPEATQSDNRRDFTPEDIQHIIQEHYNWLNSEGREGKRANFRNGQLQGVDLSGTVLVEASLRGANLSEANMSQVDLRGADLSEAILDQTNLTYSNLSGAVLARADMRTAKMEGSVFEGADFSASGLIGANMGGLNLASANFLQADLQSANLTGANLTGATLRDTNCYYANFTNANLSQAQCRNANFQQAVLENVNFEGANLKGAKMDDANLSGADLNQAAEFSPELKEGTLNAERQQLNEQQAKLEQAQSALQQRELAVGQQIAQLEKRERDAMRRTHGVETFASAVHDVMGSQKKTQGRLKLLSILWLVLGLIVMGGVITMVAMINYAELNLVEISVVVLIASLIIALSIATLMTSGKTARGLTRISKTYEETLGHDINHPHTEAEAQVSSESLPPTTHHAQPVPPPTGERA